MTDFFDRAVDRLDDIPDEKWWAAAPTLERRVVFDCTVAAMLPGFPADLRLAVHRAILAHGVNTIPSEAPEVDFETDDQHRHRLRMLFGALHNVFHEVARRGIFGLTDDPRSGLRKLYDDADDERAALAKNDPDRKPRSLFEGI